MGECILHGNGGGGGASLNFKVVGGTSAPSNPTENTIWVNTDTPISSWIFSAKAPSSAEVGKVWIYVGASSSVEFNALKKNGIQIYPISAKQYVGGAWVAKTAQTYQSGAWVDWIHPDIAKIYNLTEVRENGTGGATVAIGEGMVLTTTSTGGAQGYVAFYSAEKIDLTNYSKLTFKGSRSSFGQAFRVGFRTGNTNYWVHSNYGNDIAASVRVETTEATYSVDVSSLNGSYYFFANFAGETSAGTATMNLSDFALT